MLLPAVRADRPRDQRLFIQYIRAQDGGLLQTVCTAQPWTVQRVCRSNKKNRTCLFELVLVEFIQHTLKSYKKPFND
jgi:polyphosphate kinase 2 (PPK2 family)